MASQRFVVEQVLLSALRHGERERYELDDEGARSIALVIAAVLERQAQRDASEDGCEGFARAGLADRPSAVAELRRVLQLAVGLRKELSSPAAADRIEQVVRENPSAVTLIALHILKIGAVDETRAFLAREGREEPLAAPRIDSHAEHETVKLAELLDPASTGRVRQVSRSRRGI